MSDFQYEEYGCDLCRFWCHFEEDQGHCLRYAPRPVHWAETEDQHGDRGAWEAVWPVTASDQWCGEFLPAKPAESERTTIRTLPPAKQPAVAAEVDRVFGSVDGPAN